MPARLEVGQLVSHGRYLKRKAPDHPMANADGWILEHRRVAAETLGRILTDDEVVHHVNGLGSDNRPENLQVMSQAEHARLHQTGERAAACRRGHTYTAETTVLLKNGKRTCRLCVRATRRKWRERNPR